MVIVLLFKEVTLVSMKHKIKVATIVAIFIWFFFIIFYFILTTINTNQIILPYFIFIHTFIQPANNIKPPLMYRFFFFWFSYSHSNLCFFSSTHIFCWIFIIYFLLLRFIFLANSLQNLHLKQDKTFCKHKTNIFI